MATPPGCGSYTVRLRERPTKRPDVFGPMLNIIEWDQIVWARRLDSHADGFVAIPPCYDDSLHIRTRCHEIEVLRDGETVMIGPVLEAKRNPTNGKWEIKFRTRSWWWEQDSVHSDWSGTDDYASIFMRLVSDLEGTYNYSGLLNLASADHGANVVHGTDTSYREWKVTEDPDAGTMIRDLADSGIDWTIVGPRLYVRGTSGLNTVPTFGAQMAISASDIAGYVWAEEDGKELANCIVIHSSYEKEEPNPNYDPEIEGSEPTILNRIPVRVVYPESPAPESCEGITKINVDLDGLDEAAALAAAKARWETRHRSATYLTMEDRSSGEDGTLGGYLLSTSSFDVNAAIPGTLATFTARFPSGTTSALLRLSEMEVEVNKNAGRSRREQVRIGLQPVGKI